MNQVSNIMYMFTHLCDKLQYLISVTYFIMCNGFASELGDYPLSVWLLNPSIYIFSPRCERYWWTAVLFSIV